MHFEWSDLITILLLIVLEGILSGDNALVLAVLVLPLPEEQQRKALRYGLLGAFILRSIATLLAVYLVKVKWIALVGGLYLLWLPYKHFTSHPDEEPDEASKMAAAAGTGFLGLSVFWATVVKVELTDLVFAVDSILVAVGLTKKTWVIIAGGLMGIVMMRLLTMQVLSLVKKYPRIIDGAYIVVAWVGFKLVVEWLYNPYDDVHWLPFHIPKEVSIGVVITLFIASFLYARLYPARPGDGVKEAAEEYEEMASPELAPGSGAEKADASDAKSETRI